jgi:hypothetical protein
MSNMTRASCFCLALAASALLISGASAKEKMQASCFVESGQDNGHAVSDYAIWNTSSVPMPKGTVVSYTTTGAPGKTFTAKAPSQVAPQGSFSSGGTEPAGNCTAWWFK